MAFFNKRYHPAGTSPGTLTKTPAPGAESYRLRLYDYDSDQLKIFDDTTAKACTPYLESKTVSWVHVEGRPSERTLRELGEAFHVHSLALEDILNTGQRPKFEQFPDQLFIVMTLPVMAEDRIESHQVSLLLGTNYLISFCETDFSPFEPIIKRLQAGAGRIRSAGADYLLYCLLDLLVDRAFPVLEAFGFKLETLEDQILEAGDQDTLAEIHLLRREMILLRRTLWPQREVINAMLRGDCPWIRETTNLYLRDCYDHTIQVMDLLETYRDMASSMLEIYLSSVSNRMNDVMRVLTVIATIFIPLTFIVGVYGMNFDRNAGPWSMPELGEPLGYLMVWLAMLVIAVGMVMFFRRRKWF